MSERQALRENNWELYKRVNQAAIEQRKGTRLFHEGGFEKSASKSASKSLNDSCLFVNLHSAYSGCRRIHHRSPKKAG